MAAIFDKAERVEFTFESDDSNANYHFDNKAGIFFLNAEGQLNVTVDTRYGENYNDVLAYNFVTKSTYVIDEKIIDLDDLIEVDANIKYSPKPKERKQNMSTYLIFADDTEHGGLNRASAWDIVESTPVDIDGIAESMSRDVVESFTDFYALENEYYEKFGSLEEDDYDPACTLDDYIEETICGRIDYQYWRLNARGQQFGTGYLWSKFVEDPIEFYNEYIKGGPDDNSDDGFDSDYWSVRLL